MTITKAQFFFEQDNLDKNNLNFIFADIRDKSEIHRHMEGAHIVFHAAALKHVIMYERSPEQAIFTNIHGVQSIIDAAISNKIEKAIFTAQIKP